MKQTSSLPESLWQRFWRLLTPKSDEAEIISTQTSSFNPQFEHQGIPDDVLLRDPGQKPNKALTKSLSLPSGELHASSTLPAPRRKTTGVQRASGHLSTASPAASSNNFKWDSITKLEASDPVHTQFPEYQPSHLNQPPYPAAIGDVSPGEGSNKKHTSIKYRVINVLLTLTVLIVLIVAAVVISNRLSSSRNGFLDGANKTNYTKGNFTVSLRFVSNVEAKYQRKIFAARERWETIILEDLPTISRLNANTEGCQGLPQTKVNETTFIDNILIYVEVRFIDGPGSTLAVSGPCRYDAQRFPRTGIMTIDVADIDQLHNANNLENVVKHEMAHVLGIGTVWDSFGLITPASASGPVQYLGAGGNLGLQELGVSGRPIVESKGGPGTARGHWSEETYKTELMTGIFSSNVAPMSRMTVRALGDLGFKVAPERADPFIVPQRRRRLRSPRNLVVHEDEDESIHNEAITGTSYGADIRTGPFYRIDSEPKSGRVVSTDVDPSLLIRFWNSLLPDA